MCEGLRAFFATQTKHSYYSVCTLEVADFRLFAPLHYAIDALFGANTVREFEAHAWADDHCVNKEKYYVILQPHKQSNYPWYFTVLKAIGVALAIIPATVLGTIVKGFGFLTSDHGYKVHQAIMQNRDPRSKDLAPAFHQIFAAAKEKDAVSTFNNLPVLPGGGHGQPTRGMILSEVSARIVQSLRATHGLPQRELEEKSKKAFPEYPQEHLSEPIYRFEYEGRWHVYFRTRGPDKKYHSYVLEHDSDNKVFIWNVENGVTRAPELDIGKDDVGLNPGAMKLLRDLLKEGSCYPGRDYSVGPTQLVDPHARIL